MQKQKGFTLIELIIVIVILGILAVSVAPKFLDVQKDARISALEGTEGAIKSAMQIVYARASLDGKQGNDATSTLCTTTATEAACEVKVSNSTVNIDFGYPVVDTTNGVALNTFMEASDLTAVIGTGTTTVITGATPTVVSGLKYSVITLSGTGVVDTYANATRKVISGTDLPVCQIVYVNATSTAPAYATAYTNGC
jgi:MSHA pilin protein MshA